jgi:hypothetical protein
MSMSNEDSAMEQEVRRVMDEVEVEVRKSLSKGVRPLHEIEPDVDKSGDRIKEAITRGIVRQAGDGYVGSRLRCPCGARAKVKKRHQSRRVIVLYGHLVFERSYYYCKSCRKGFCPVDRILDLGPDDLSRCVKAVVARVSSYLPFYRATDELAALRGVHLSCTTVQRHAKRVGMRISEEWERNLQDFDMGHARDSGMYPKRLYLGMDAASCHVGGQWCDAKLGAAYHRDKDGLICNATYYASLEKSHQFGFKMGVLAHLSGADHCDDLEVLGDGAPWIWIEKTKHLPKAVEGIDYYHVTEHLDEVVKCLGLSKSLSKYWISTQKRRLLADQVETVISDLRKCRPTTRAGEETRRKAVNYMETNKARMLYKTLREQGYDIGSGAVESACKNVIKARLGGSGMRWEEPGAKAVLHLSAFWRSDNCISYLAYA